MSYLTVSAPSSYPSRRHPRLAGYDYYTPGYYFITVCTQHRLPLFGSVKAGQMHLSPAGTMVQETWRDLQALHAGVEIDTNVVMPDHIHAIVVLADKPERMLSLVELVQRYKALTTKRSAYEVRNEGWQRFACRLWQESFYDHVILQDAELNAVRRYVLENPLRWELRRDARGQADMK